MLGIKTLWLKNLEIITYEQVIESAVIIICNLIGRFRMNSDNNEGGEFGIYS